MLGAALQPAPSTAPPGDAGDPAANSSFRALAIETLCDLMRRGQSSDGRRQAATTALRYLSQLDRLAHLDRIAAQRRPAPAESPASFGLPSGPPQQAQLPPAQSTPFAKQVLLPAPEPATSPLPAPQLPVAPSPPPPAPAALPTRAELNMLLEAVRDTAATTQPIDSQAISFPPALDSLPSVCAAPLAIESDPRVDPAYVPRGMNILARGPSRLRALSIDSPRPARPGLLISAAGAAPSG